MDYSEFLRTAEDFVFAEDQPEKADIIFVPGNGFPQMAERAGSSYIKKAMLLIFCPAEDTALPWGNLWECSLTRKFMTENMRRNGNS